MTTKNTSSNMASNMTPNVSAPAPMALLAELTHRCPLSCPYCSNPLEMIKRDEELDTHEWADVFHQAAALGVLHVHLSGGEPVARRDLADLCHNAHEAGLYTNLITSGIGLTEQRLHDLVVRGLDHVQLSIQGISHATADTISGYRGGLEKKLHVARMVREAALPLTLNAVMNRINMEDLPRTIDLAEELGARRLEVATVQFHGWALKNVAALLPTREQAAEAHRIVNEARERLKGVLVIDFVPADYYEDYPKACMGGWGNVGLNIAPDGTVLPCHAAHTIPHLSFENVRRMPLRDIWYESPSFNAYRGVEWMNEPCRSCEYRTRDFGGCRCQAMSIAGDAAQADPVCIRSPHHGTISDTLNAALTKADETPALTYRTMD